MLKVNTPSFNMTARSLTLYSKGMREAVERDVLEAMGKMLEQRVRTRIGLTDHTLDDLQDLDHPYARRHGAIQIHRDRPYQVHKQSGQLMSSLSTSQRKGSFDVFFDVGRAEHAQYVVQGTKLMLPRDTLWRTATEKETIRALRLEAIRILGKVHRTHAVIRFGPARG